MPGAQDRTLRGKAHGRAPAGSTERGSDYVTWGAVGRIDVSEAQVAAWVLGSKRYGVRLFVDGNALGFECTCPIGEQLGVVVGVEADPSRAVRPAFSAPA